MTCRSKFFPYLQRRPGRRDTALQSFELRIKAKDKIMHEDMFVTYVVAWQPTPMQLWVRIPPQYRLFVFIKILIFIDNYYLVNKSVLDKKNYIFEISVRYRIE